MLQRKQSVRREKVFLVHGARHGGFVEVERLRDILEGQRHQRLISFVHKALLYRDDLGRNAENGLIPLLETSDEPLCLAQVFFEVFSGLSDHQHQDTAGSHH